jgi:hypothetical protein
MGKKMPFYLKVVRLRVISKWSFSFLKIFCWFLFFHNLYTFDLINMGSLTGQVRFTSTNFLLVIVINIFCADANTTCMCVSSSQILEFVILFLPRKEEKRSRDLIIASSYFLWYCFLRGLATEKKTKICYKIPSLLI